MPQITTTLNRIRAHGLCGAVWKKLLAGLNKTSGDDETLPYADILRINGLDDALWCCRAEQQYGREWRLFAVWCARQVQHLMTDPRSVAALDVAEKYAKGGATKEDLVAARAAARAAWAAARAAGDAAGGAAWAAAWAAAAAAAVAAREAAVDAKDAARAARAAARDVACASQAQEFLRIVSGEPA